ncbi:MAG TPA: hypothetical protein PLD88_14765, partial [Candidatus Berkiella sp.]|nr:hypothetical protein [Candidatus Berkiella sp.]
PLFADFARNLSVLIQEIPRLLLSLIRNTYQVFRQIIIAIPRLIQAVALNMTDMLLFFFTQQLPTSKMGYTKYGSFTEKSYYQGIS